MSDNNTRVYHSYILSRVVTDIIRVCQEEAPNEALGRLLGYRQMWQGIPYVRIVDWVGGQIENSHTHAQFTQQGTREGELFLDERYGNSPSRPVEVGLFHSHPFGFEPHFSGTDHQTFLNFPYDREGNIFILTDPLSDYFKVFRISLEATTKEKYLQQIPWIIYQPK